MFQKVISYKGFWKSVLSLALAFAVVFTIIKWAISGFSGTFFSEGNPIRFIAGVLIAGFAYGFFVTFGKFRAKLKDKESRE
ncbi:hypothetical protein [Ulvibacter antarcticus]|uniref:Uncharacterized protein n=1 Tax=Ulvibacter antarcticus TaxID=442714 RepID=A0A3L9YCH6_9FLAO|nr:hypothetical protein [Ulvibacter antarcticus]RMA57197.1 hypothetical protein BXY75_3084 [Ulvibacter antarcticus]